MPTGTVSADDSLPDDAAEKAGVTEIDLDFTDAEWREMHAACRSLGVSVQELVSLAIQQVVSDLEQ